MEYAPHLLWSLDDGPEPAAIKELDNESDRSAAIVAGSIVEQKLEAAIRSRFHPHEVMQQNLFRPSGALGSFSVKIDLAFLLGLVSSTAHRELATFKEIRNSFAHQLEVTSFKSQRITDLCNNLRIFLDYIDFLDSTSFQSRVGSLVDYMKTNNLLLTVITDNQMTSRDRYIYSAYVFVHFFREALKADRVIPLPTL